MPSFPKRTVWTFHTTPAIYFGVGAVDRLADILARLGAETALLVTDAVVFSHHGRRVMEAAARRGARVHVFDGGAPEPTFDLVAEALRTVPRCDAVISLGGGSNTDLAKCIALGLRYPEWQDFVGEGRVPGPILPVVSISTTAGTGAEVSGVAVLTDRRAHLKVGIADNHLRPRAAVFDPVLTVTCPPRVTADAGMDALTHAIEAYTAVDFADLPVEEGHEPYYQGRTPLTDALAREAVRLIGRHLLAAYREPEDLAARTGMHLGSLLAGLAFSNAGVTATHALEYAVGPAAGLSHGLGNGLLLPYVMEFNLPARRREFARIAALLGEDTDGLSEEEAARRAVERVRRLRAELGVPDRLRDVGIPRSALPELARRAASATRIVRNQPRPAGYAELLAILEAAY